MTSIPSTQAIPLSPTLTKPTVGVEKSSADETNKEEELRKAKETFADEMKRLYPDGINNKSGNTVFANEETLKHIVEHGTIEDADGKRQLLPDETRKAVQTILDNGGPASINPNGDPWFTETDLRRSIENDRRSPTQKSEDFLNGSGGNKV
ncbi:hypothetical protein RY831_02540 [Noviherbaspirillum sp. CPCC 100848]|uniref:Uncharacterized protein n=1 Tax=Noviherbaspirillum album TaxID=3080276 RepID=A0ABU6J311_9BURK|nr:hypothetical protein [Noviherbaspirillum sp. CPCC 100848]MEC4718016.1 hypothetical protein [Noviherbaspirillum sp. CPCC 100848]